jgi:tRNA U55 pseudouridine synthase TruB
MVMVREGLQVQVSQRKIYLYVLTNKDDTQAEHVDIAMKIKEEINKIFPLE